MNFSVANGTGEKEQGIIKMLNYVLYSLVIVLGVPGNVLVIWSLGSIRREQVSKSYKILVTNLAINDIMMILMSIPFTVAELFTDPYYPFGPVMCIILSPLQTAIFGAGVFNMVALNIHRYYVITYSSSSRSLERITVVAVIACWIIPTLVTAVPFAPYLEYNAMACNETWHPTSAKAYTVYLFLLQYLLPLIVIATLNTLTIRRLRRGRLFRVNCARLSEENLHAHRRIVKMLVLIVLVFALFGLPGQIMWLIASFTSIDISIEYFSLLDIFPFYYCVLNPVLFFTYNIECREKLKKVIATAFVCCGYDWQRNRRFSSQTRLRTDVVATLLSTRTSDSQDTSQSDGPRYDPRFSPAIPKYILEKLEKDSQEDSPSSKDDKQYITVPNNVMPSLTRLNDSFHGNSTSSGSLDCKTRVLGAAVDKDLFRGSFVELLRKGNVNNELVKHLEASPETAIVEESICEASEFDDQLPASPSTTYTEC